jgi:hypothetical protein
MPGHRIEQDPEDRMLELQQQHLREKANALRSLSEALEENRKRSNFEGNSDGQLPNIENIKSVINSIKNLNKDEKILKGFK